MRTEDDSKKQPEVRRQVSTLECVLTSYVPTFSSSEPVICALTLFVATDRHCRGSECRLSLNFLFSPLVATVLVQHLSDSSESLIELSCSAKAFLLGDAKKIPDMYPET